MGLFTPRSGFLILRTRDEAYAGARALWVATAQPQPHALPCSLCAGAGLEGQVCSHIDRSHGLRSMGPSHTHRGGIPTTPGAQVPSRRVARPRCAELCVRCAALSSAQLSSARNEI